MIYHFYNGVLFVYITSEFCTSSSGFKRFGIEILSNLSNHDIIVSLDSIVTKTLIKSGRKCLRTYFWMIQYESFGTIQRQCM